ncbi:MAG: hypothetical protein MI717_09755, partial [Spirochaetales bacterium]|nr:hypothetical protein [Spirochaetales bacterium]
MRGLLLAVPIPIGADLYAIVVAFEGDDFLSWTSDPCRRLYTFPAGAWRSWRPRDGVERKR